MALTVIDEKNIFLLDGLGAVVSAFSIGVLLTTFQPWIGMPLEVLYLLAALAVGFAFYSLTRYKFADLSRPIWLKGIIFLNLFYCGLSLFFVVAHFEALTTLGLTYFVLEKVVVLFIVALEWRTLSRSF